MSDLSTKPNGPLGCAILVVGGGLIALFAAPAVFGIVFGLSAMLGLIWVVYQAIHRGSPF